MAHNIETHGRKAAFASARLDAWHQLGTVTEGAMTAEEALRIAHLANWNVRKEALQAVCETGSGTINVSIADKFATVRNSPWTGEPEVLGTVGKLYRPIQNEEHCELLNTLVDQSGAHFETAGALRGGREIFVTMKLPEQMKVAGVDDVDLYIAAMNSHDGTTPFRLIVTPIRVVCANTQHMALQQARSTFNIRHTRSARGYIEEARQALQLTFKYQDAFQQEAERMLAQAMTDAQFNSMINKLFLEPSADASNLIKSRHKDAVDQLNYLFSDAETNEVIRGTRWAGYQAVVEYVDHFKPAKLSRWADNIETARALSSLGSTALDLKQDSYKLASV